jgi:hypothetical protein
LLSIDNTRLHAQYRAAVTSLLPLPLDVNLYRNWESIPMDQATNDSAQLLADLIAKYPNRWSQAVGNPALRWWFVNKLVGSQASMVDRVAASTLIDRRAGEPF